jgi:hypothetical protein
MAFACPKSTGGVLVERYEISEKKTYMVESTLNSRVVSNSPSR